LFNARAEAAAAAHSSAYDPDRPDSGAAASVTCPSQAHVATSRLVDMQVRSSSSMTARKSRRAFDATAFRINRRSSGEADDILAAAAHRAADQAEAS